MDYPLPPSCFPPKVQFNSIQFNSNHHQLPSLLGVSQGQQPQSKETHLDSCFPSPAPFQKDHLKSSSILTGGKEHIPTPSGIARQVVAQGRALKSSQARQRAPAESNEAEPKHSSDVVLWPHRDLDVDRAQAAVQGAGCMREQQCPGGAVGPGTHLGFPCVQVTQRKQTQNGTSWWVPAASLGIVPAASRLSPLLSQAALSMSSAEEWSILTHLGKKKKSTFFAPARLKIGAVSSLGKGNSQLPTEDWTAPGCSAAGCPQVLPQFPVPGHTLLGRGSSPKEGLLL